MPNSLLENEFSFLSFTSFLLSKHSWKRNLCYWWVMEMGSGNTLETSKVPSLLYGFPPSTHPDRQTFNKDLSAMKQFRRRLECKWRKNPTDCNWIAVRVTTNLYLAKVKATSRVHLANRIREASNQQADFFCIVRNLSRIGLGEKPPPQVSHRTNSQHF